MKILGAVLELPAKQHCQSSPFTSTTIYLKTGPNWPNWQCCLPGSSKRAPRILIFNCHGCRLFILCEIHCYLSDHIFLVYYFSLSQCGLSKFGFAVLKLLVKRYYFLLKYFLQVCTNVPREVCDVGQKEVCKDVQRNECKIVPVEKRIRQCSNKPK